MEKFKLYCKLRSSGNNPELALRYRQACKSLKQLVKSAVLNFEINLVSKCKTNHKLLFSYINEQKSCHEHIRTLSKPNGDQTSNETDIVQILNDQFCQVFNKHTSQHNVIPYSPRIINTHRTNQSLFSKDNVLKYINNLTIHKPAGPDGLHPWVIKESSRSFAQVLSKIFTNSYITGTLPVAWKRANITPIFKKKDRTDPSNYRPISLTSIPCKLMERIIRDEMIEHLTSNNLISSEQHGFVTNKSCLTNLIETIDAITNAMNEGSRVVLIFLDFAKAFDKVCHASLASKLESYGFCKFILNWLIDFLKNRTQRVVIGNNKSSWQDVTSGVPQGSCLGPLLFTIFINDMPKVVQHTLKLFADDSKLIAVIKNNLDLDTLQQDIDELTKWSREWRMMFHPEKCKAMDIGNKDIIPLSLSMETIDPLTRHTLAITTEEKDLGVTVTNNLKFDKHVSLAVAKANSVLGQLKRTFINWNIKTFLVLYTSFVRPHLEYAAPVWSPHRRKDVVALEKVQRRATKLIPSLKKLSYNDRLKSLNITTLEERRIRGDIIFLFKIINGYNFVTWKEKIFFKPAINTKSRPHNLVPPPIPKIAQRENFFLNRTIPYWNRLPLIVTSAKTLNQFKNRLDKSNFFNY